MPVNNIEQWFPGMLHWLEAFIVMVWVFHVVFTKTVWKLDVFFARFKHRLRRRLPKWTVIKHHHGSDGILDWHVLTENDFVCLKRISWWDLPILIVFLVIFSGACVLLLLLLVSSIFKKGDWPEGWWRLIPILLLMGFSFFVFLLCWIIPSEAISNVRFLMADRKTIVTYLGMVHRPVPELPSKIKLGMVGSGSSFARLVFPGRKFSIPLFCTAKGGFDTSSQAIQYALNQTTRLRECLHLEVEKIE